MSKGYLHGRTALVTGSVQGIGLAIAKALGAEGARVGVHGLADKAQIEAAQAEIRAAGASQTRFFDADLTDLSAIEAMMSAAADWGPIDILVNNAGIQKTTPLADATAQIWDAVIAVNLT
nr:SDR family NAD(P)-dependent oxidoreductase [Rhizobiaceae bacterium]